MVGRVDSAALRKRAFWIVPSLLLVAGIVSVWVATAQSPWSTGPLNEAMELPAVWEAELPSAPDALGESGRVRMTLNANGSAVLTNFPMGVMDSDDSAKCFKSRPGVYSGRGAWTTTDDGVLRVTFPDNEVTLWSDAAFLDLDWRDLTLADCDEVSPMMLSGGYDRVRG